MTAGILVCGLIAVASVFSFAIRTNAGNRQIAVATTLLYNKMEEFRSAPLNDSIWTNGSVTETLVIAGDAYIRVSHVRVGIPRTVTVTIYVENNALTRRRTELLRATTLKSAVF